MAPIDLSTPMRQSRKGILIIFGYRLFSFFKKSFVLFVAYIFTLLKRKSFDFIQPQHLIVGLVLLLLVVLVISILRYYHFKFFLDKDDFHLTSGILNKETIILSKSKIQNVYTKQSFLHRLVGVVSLNIESAGDKNSEIEISALDEATALRLKRELFSRSDANTESLENQEQFFYQVSLRKLFLEGITQNHIKSFVVILTFVAGLYYENKDFFKGFDLEKFIANQLKLNNDDALQLFFVNLILLLLLLLFSILVSMGKLIMTNFNLKVAEFQNKLEISKGLFQTMTLTLLPKRIQNLQITTNRLKAYYGLQTLTVKQAMVNEKNMSNFSIVGLDAANMTEILKHLIPSYIARSNEAKQYPDRYYKRILAIRYSLIGLIFNLLVYNALGAYIVIVIMISLVLIYICVNKAYKKRFFYVDDEHLTIGSGLIERRTNMMALPKLQSVSVTQNIFQKKRQLATLVMTSSSQSLKIPYIKQSQAQLISDFLLFKLESQDLDWM